MSGYVKKIWPDSSPNCQKEAQYSPHQPLLRKYGTKSQETLPEDTTKKVNAE
jgi:hypothetical protein